VRYLLLLANDNERIAAWEQLDPEEARRQREAETPRWRELFRLMEERGSWVSGLELDVPRTAKTIREDGLVTDGPYAETKEQIGGYFVVECASLDEAIDLAALVPVAETGSVEIRPIAQ